MSIRQPKPKQIRLPFNVPRPKKGAEPQAKVCGICRRADSRYTCPRCNVAYCSLACFRDPAHAQCSEPFYRTTVMDQIAADPRADLEEKRNMVNMLRRFEAAAAEGDDALAALEAEEAEDEDEDDGELAAALEGVDLDTIDSNALLRLLPQAHRDAFLASLRDPECAAARELLDTAIADGEGETVPEDADGGSTPAPAVLPWWEADALDPTGEAAHAPPPEDLTNVIASIHPPPGVGAKLAYNVVAVCVAYVHVLLSNRLVSLVAADAETARDVRTELLALLPILAPKSTLRYDTARSAWGAVWERAGETAAAAGSAPLPPQALTRVLDIVARMLHPPLTLDHPLSAALVLADVYRLLAHPREGPAAKKVAFYRAAVSELGRSEWLRLEREVRRDGDVVEHEMGLEEGEGSVVGESGLQRGTGVPLVTPMQPRASTPTGGAKIELLD